MNVDDEVFLYVFVLKCLCLLLLFLCTVGIIGNTLLLVTTIRSKCLRSPCNFLIGCCALADIFHQLGHYPPAPAIFLRQTMHSRTCSLIMFLPEMGVAAGSSAVLSIGIDRLLSVAMPNKYRSLNVAEYLAIHLIVIVSYCAYIVFLMIHFYRDDEIVCAMANVFRDEGVVWWAYSFTAVHFISFAVYFVTWRVIKAQSQSLESANLKRIFRTIVLVTIFDLGGWTITQTIVATLPILSFPEYINLCVIYFAALFVNFGLAIKFFIYYFTSCEYRKAVRQQFNVCGRSMKISSTSNDMIMQ